MKKNILKSFIVLCITLGLIHTNVSALEVITEEDVTIITEQTSDIVIAGGEVDIQSTLQQDAIIFGGDLLINAPVFKDLMFAGGDVSINEEVKDDIRGVGGNITIDNNVTGDVILAAGDIRIKKGVTIGGDLIIAAGKANIQGDVLGKLKFVGAELKLNGKIGGDAQIYVDKFKTSSGSDASIGGNLIYRAESKLDSLEKITTGVINYEEAVSRKQFKKDIKESIISYHVVKILFIFIFSTVLFFFFQKFYNKAGKILAEQTGKSFLYGILTFLLLPVLAILFFISIIGVPIGFLLLFWFVILIIFLEVINVTVLTALIIEKFPKFNVNYIKILIMLILSIFMTLINGIDIIIGFFTVGAILILKKEILAKVRDMD